MGNRIHLEGEPRSPSPMEDAEIPYFSFPAVRKGKDILISEKMVAFSSFYIAGMVRHILHLDTSRSLQRYKQQKQTFDPLQSEKIIQVIFPVQKRH
jgi:hypothetical protein